MNRRQMLLGAAAAAVIPRPAEIDAELKRMWDKYRVVPTQVWYRGVPLHK